MLPNLGKRYLECLDFLYKRNQFSIKLGLEKIESFLKALNNPHHSLKCIQVGGTNGKGSVSRFLSDLLPHRGYRRIGLYTSPHLVSFRERISINQEPISKKWMVQWIEKYKQEIIERELTYFEIITAMALDYFFDQKCDVVVLEVGLGGRLDATTAVTPSLCVITSVDLDHVDILGNTIEEIWEEKIGILKPRVPLVTGEKRSHLLATLEERANAHKSPLHIVRESLPLESFEGSTSKFSEIARWNASLAWQALEYWEKQNSKQDEDGAIEFMLNLTPPLGRQTCLTQGLGVNRPPVVLDGAHNPKGVEALKKFVKDLSKNRFEWLDGWVVVYATMSDKDFESGCIVAESFGGRGNKKIYQEMPNHPRALKYDEFIHSENCQDKQSWECWRGKPSLERVQQLLVETQKNNKGIILFGSFYLLGEWIPMLSEYYEELAWYKQFQDDWEGASKS